MQQRRTGMTKATWTLAVVLVMASFSAALQTTIPVTVLPMTAASKAPEFAKATVHFVLVSIPDRKLALLENGKVVRIYRVAVGKASTPSPAGSFKVVNRVTNPTYYHKGNVIAAGKANPVGTRWMGLSVKGYGIHGTNQPGSIGKAASTGCIRMGQRDLEEFFERVGVGDAVEIRAERNKQAAQIFGNTGDGNTGETETFAELYREVNSEARNGSAAGIGQ